DNFGDMDFKVAGTADFVTALQLDTKIDGLPADVLAKALQQARDARLQILAVMNEAISEARDHVAATAPKIVSFEIPIDKIGEVIDQQGKVALSLVGDAPEGDGGVNGDREPATVGASSSSRSSSGGGGGAGSDREYVSFEETFEAEAQKEFGDLGPADTEQRG